MNTRVRELKRAIKTIKAARRWLPGLVQAMRESGIYGLKWPKNTARITEDRYIREINNSIKLEQKNTDSRKKWARILKPGLLYELKIANDRTVLVQIVRFNNNSVKIKLLAHDYGSNEVGRFGLIEYTRVNMGWYYAPFGFDRVRSSKEISRTDLPTYIGMNITEHFEAMLKEAGNEQGEAHK